MFYFARNSWHSFGVYENCEYTRARTEETTMSYMKHHKFTTLILQRLLLDYTLNTCSASCIYILFVFVCGYICLDVSRNVSPFQP